MLNKIYGRNRKQVLDSCESATPLTSSATEYELAPAFLLDYFSMGPDRDGFDDCLRSCCGDPLEMIPEHKKDAESLFCKCRLHGKTSMHGGFGIKSQPEPRD